MRKNKGFTLIELMIVIAIIAIIAAIAIPNLMQSRIRANETATVSQLRNYVQSQSLFHGRGFGRIATNTNAVDVNQSAYADNFANLYYGTDVVGVAGAPAAGTNAIHLISRAHADAIAVIPAPYGIATVATIETPPSGSIGTVFNGYFYTEPQEIANLTPATWFQTRFAQISLPANSSRTGTRAFFIDDGGNVLGYLLVANQDIGALVGATPTPLGGTANWVVI